MVSVRICGTSLLEGPGQDLLTVLVPMPFSYLLCSRELKKYLLNPAFNSLNPKLRLWQLNTPNCKPDQWSEFLSSIYQCTQDLLNKGCMPYF